MAGWIPARPERETPVWGAPDPARPPAASASAPLADDGPRPGSGPSAPRPRRLARLVDTPLRRVLAGLVALVLAIAVVAGVGTALTPRYGDLAPWQVSSPVADLRTKPTAIGWTVDLAREVLPGVPVRCAGFTSSQSTGRFAVVTGQTPPLGSSTRCSQDSLSQVQSTVAVLDTDTGTVLWHRDLSASFPSRLGAVTLDSEQVVTRASRVLVQLTADGSSTLASLSLRTGTVMSSVTLPSGDTTSEPEVEGTLVLYNSSVAREGASGWTLADVRTIDQPRWSGVLDDATRPLLTAGAAFARLGGISSRIDGTTGRVSRLGDGTVSLAQSTFDAGAVVTTQIEQAGTVVSLWNESGRRVWSRAGLGAASGLTRDCVIVSLVGTSKGTCLDRSTGRTRWTADVGNGSFAFAVPGQTSSDVMIYRNKANETELDVLDGRTGRLRFPLTLAVVNFTNLSSRTTGYVQIASDSGTPTGIAAYDTVSGRQLWSLEEASTRDTAFWGGQLVRVTRNGIAEQLVDRRGTVLGE